MRNVYRVQESPAVAWGILVVLLTLRGCQEVELEDHPCGAK